MTPLDALRDALARVVSAEESFSYGDGIEGLAILRDLRVDMTAFLIGAEEGDGGA